MRRIKVNRLLCLALISVAALFLAASSGQAEEGTPHKKVNRAAFSLLNSSGNMSRSEDFEHANLSMQGLRWGNWSLGIPLPTGFERDFYASKWALDRNDFYGKWDALRYSPVGLQVGRTLSFGNQTMSLSAEFGWSVLHHGDTRMRDWAGSMRIILLFPEK